jgi:hypothetical protein
MRRNRTFLLRAGREQDGLADRIARSASPTGPLIFPGWIY